MTGKNTPSTIEKRGIQHSNGCQPKQSGSTHKESDSEANDRKRRRVNDDQGSTEDRFDLLLKEIKDLRNVNTQVVTKLQTSHQNYEQQTIASLKNNMEKLKGRLEMQSICWLEDLMYSRSNKFQLPVEDIESFMIELGSVAEEVTSLMIDDKENFTWPPSSLNSNQHSELFKLKKKAVLQQPEKKDSEWKSYVMRGIIMACISTYVLDDLFPNLRKDKVVEEMQKILEERGGNKAAKLLEYLSQDARYNLSQKPDLTNIAIPNRAAELTQRLTKTLAPFLSPNLATADLSLVQNYNLWIVKIKDMFMTALKFVVRFQLQSAPIVMFWPETGAVFERGKMRAVNPGPADIFNAREVMLTIMPAVMIESEDKSQRVLSKAVVFLKMPAAKSTAQNLESGRQFRQIASVQYSDDIMTTFCSNCGITRVVLDPRKNNQICNSCSAQQVKESIEAPKHPIASNKVSAGQSDRRSHTTDEATRSTTAVAEPAQILVAKTCAPSSHDMQEEVVSVASSRETTPPPYKSSDSEYDGEEEDEDEEFTLNIKSSPIKPRSVGRTRKTEKASAQN